MTTPRAPSGLQERSRRLWRAVVDSYELSDAELEVLRCACEALDRADAAAATVKAEGITIRDRYGVPKCHPAAELETRNRGLFARLVLQLGVKAVADHVESAATSRARRAAEARWGRPGARRRDVGSA